MRFNFFISINQNTKNKKTCLKHFCLKHLPIPALHHFSWRVTKIELVEARLRALLYDRMFSRKWRPVEVWSLSKVLCEGWFVMIIRKTGL